MIIRYRITYDNDVYEAVSLEMDPKDYSVTAVTVLRGDELVRLTNNFDIDSWTGSYDVNGKPIYTGDKVIKNNKVETIPAQEPKRSYCYVVN